jgi:hypothetical protein
MAVSPINPSQAALPPVVNDKKATGATFESLLKDAGVNGATSPPPEKTVEQELADYVNMTPAQRMRADILKELGLSEEQLAAMPPEQRKAVDAKIAKIMSQQEQQHQQQVADPKKGKAVDISV